VEKDPARRRALTTFVVVGGGLVGVELIGELTEFVDSAARYYPNVDRQDIRFVLIEAGPRLLMEMEDDLAGYAADVLRGRGVDVRAGTRVKQIEPGRIHLPDGPDGQAGEVIEAMTVIVSTGVRPAPLVDSFDLKKDARGRIEVGPDMRSVSRPDVWALGDNAAIPDAHNVGKWYPPLAQHALREARVLAKNLVAAKDGQPTRPFVYSSKGTLASLGQFKGVGKVIPFGKKGIKIYGLIGWWVWRTYYLFQMPRLSRRLRIMADWTISLVFKNDVAKLDTYGGEALRKQITPAPQALMPGTAVTGPSPQVTPARPPPEPVGA
jgi:NADH dehydrogenase